MKRSHKLGSAVVVALVLTLTVASAVFAAGPYASAITSAGGDAVTDLTASIADAFPYLLGLAVVTLIARKVLAFFKR